MPRADSWDVGVPAWVDVSTTDPAAARRFYRSLFGWDCEDRFDGDTLVYTMLRLHGRHAAGLGALPSDAAARGATPAWTTHIAVADTDATALAVANAGGRVLRPPMDVSDAGRTALFEDSAGAAFAVWQPGTHAGAAVVNEPGSLCWNELSTTDPKAAMEFYGTVFGWSARHDDTADQAPYTEFHLGGRTIAGMTDSSGEGSGDSHWLTYFAVNDCDGTVEKAIAHGGDVLVPPIDVPPGRYAVLRDPQGAVFGVIALAA